MMKDPYFSSDYQQWIQTVKENMVEIEDLYNYIDDEQDKKLYDEKYNSTIDHWRKILEYFWRDEEKYKYLIESSKYSKEKELESLYTSMKLMTELNQKSMQTPYEEEKKRSSQVEEIKKRVNDLTEKLDQKTRLYTEINNELKEEKDRSNKMIAEITAELSEVDDKNYQSMKVLTKNFETKSEESKKLFEDQKFQKTTEKEKYRKALEQNKGKIFKAETIKIKEYLDSLDDGLKNTSRYDKEMNERYEEFRKLEDKYKQLMYEKQRLEMQQLRHSEEEAWKKRVDMEYANKLEAENQKKIEYEQAAEWLQAIFKSVQQILNKKSKGKRKR
eukprot:Mrub_05500.p1 GENE.Mrub_05500~~Mrub_05500.p1  ORF type:complete len:359 (+),score=94.10 Mrub_05500:88-1077(+)